MASRPYFQKSIKELEALFATQSIDSTVLGHLKAELSFRSTQRAKTLEDKVIKATQVIPKTEGKREQWRTPEAPTQTTMEFPPSEQTIPQIKKATLKRSDLGPKPAVANAPQDILRAWTALEVLSPQGYKREADLVAGDNSKIARFDERDLPWELGEKSRPKKRLYYELILGSVALAPAVEELLKLYSDDRPDKPSMLGSCPIASILLDKEGRPLEEETSAAISSFAWGIPIALQGDLRSLADWPHQERQLLTNFRKRLIKRDRNDDVVSLTKKHIRELFDHLVQSLNRMFSRLPAEALGWLLVDEAGQALPQAGVGAMIRTKNSVVVGDPLQIEPVVTLPKTLTEEICGFFGIDPLKYNAPDASVQTVADAASMYCARFPIGSGHRDVGAPLLVHRRCDSPMFDISNEIAYANLMVQAKMPSGDVPVLGPSCWIDVAGKPGPDKWCADEASVLIDLLRKLRDAGENPDLYIVTPFVIVQNNLRQELLKSGVLDGWTTNPNAWVWEHVGTVHTVQGREATRHRKSNNALTRRDGISFAALPHS